MSASTSIMHHKNYLILIQLLLLITSIHPTASADNDDVTVDILLRVKQNQFQDPHNNLDDWLNSTKPCNWTGITCGSRRNHIVSINLASLNIYGPFPFDFCRIPTLRNLNLSDNFFSGQINPDSISICSNLVTLNLSSNLFIGDLPDFKVPFLNLTILDLSSNNFSGEIPISFANLNRLQILSITENQLNGSIPEFLWNLTDLTQLLLTGNPYRTSQLPRNIGRLAKLEKLLASFSNLIGDIPDSIGNLTSIKIFDVANNNLVGKIPDSIGDMINVVQIELLENQLSGELPDTFANLTALLRFEASKNNLTGKIPESLAALALESLHLNDNFLEGEIPQSIASNPVLYHLKLFNNSLSGSLPQNLGLNSGLEELDVSSNNLEGPLPPKLCGKKNLWSLIISDNRFSGRIPDSYGECITLTYLRIANNELSGAVPKALWGLRRLKLIELTNNRLEGSVPESIAALTAVKQLLISGNKFSGEFPAGICNLIELRRIHSAGNKFSGEFPSCVNRLSNLQELHMGRNNFSGQIPMNFTGLGQLAQLDFSMNQLSGVIPSSLGSLRMLIYLNISNNMISGVIPEDLTKLRLSVFDISNNKLHGQVPLEFGCTSSIPDLFGNAGLCSPFVPTLPRCSESKHTHKKSYNYLLVGVLSAGAVISVVLLVLLGLKTKKLINFGGGRSQTWKVTTFQKVKLDEEDVLASLKDENLIGSGGSGCVYRVVLKSGKTVAAKKLWEVKGAEPEEAFRAEVDTMGGIRHVNIVKLLFTCISEDYRILVYEYLGNGSLGDVLRDLEGGGVLLDWPKRFSIAMGTAQGLAYLHHDCVPAIMHRDLKSNNILLDEELNPKVADFGLSRMLKRDESYQLMSRIAGSYGYIAPEYAYTMKVTEKSDVYSFGIVLLELLTGKKPNDPFFGENMSIIKWVKDITLPSLKRGRNGNATDNIMITSLNQILDIRMDAEIIKYQEVKKVLNVALLCTVESPDRRPSMRKVVELLKKC